MKKTLDEKSAKEFAIKNLEEISNEEDRKFNIAHTQAVVESALLLAEGRHLSKKDLVIAAWLHDIGQKISRDNHAEHSVEIVKKDFEINEIIQDCILNHGNGKNPETREGRILQVADKLSVLDRGIAKILVTYSLKKEKESKIKDLGFISKLANKAIELLSEFDYTN